MAILGRSHPRAPLLARGSVSLNLRHNFDGGSAGTGITSPDASGGTPLDFVTISASATLVYDTDAAHGANSALSTTTSGSAQDTKAGWNTRMGTQTRFYFEAYFKFAAFPAAAISIFRFLSGASLTCRLGLGTTGKLSMVDNVGAVHAFVGSIALGQWIRIEGFVDHVAQTYEVRLFNTAEAALGSYDERFSGAFTLLSNSTVYEFGRTGLNTAAVTFRFDEIGLATDTWIGPLGAILPITPVIAQGVGGISEIPTLLAPVTTIPAASALSSSPAPVVLGAALAAAGSLGASPVPCVSQTVQGAAGLVAAPVLGASEILQSIALLSGTGSLFSLIVTGTATLQGAAQLGATPVSATAVAFPVAGSMTATGSPAVKGNLTGAGALGAPGRGPALFADAFGRTITSGLGSADVGGVWTASAGISANGSQSVFVVGINSTGEARLDSGPQPAELDMRWRTQWADNGGTNSTSAGFRYQDGNNFYFTRLTKSAATFVVEFVKRVGGTPTVIASFSLGLGAWVDNTWWWQRTLVTNVGTATRIQTKAWLDGQPEPSAWMVDWLETSPLWASGKVNFRASAGASGGVTFLADDIYGDAPVGGPVLVGPGTLPGASSLQESPVVAIPETIQAVASITSTPTTVSAFATGTGTFQAVAVLAPVPSLAMAAALPTAARLTPTGVPVAAVAIAGVAVLAGSPTPASSVTLTGAVQLTGVAGLVGGIGFIGTANLTGSAQLAGAVPAVVTITGVGSLAGIPSLAGSVTFTGDGLLAGSPAIFTPIVTGSGSFTAVGSLTQIPVVVGSPTIRAAAVLGGAGSPAVSATISSATSMTSAPRIGVSGALAGAGSLSGISRVAAAITFTGTGGLLGSPTGFSPFVPGTAVLTGVARLGGNPTVFVVEAAIGLVGAGGGIVGHPGASATTAEPGSGGVTDEVGAAGGKITQPGSGAGTSVLP